MVKGLKNALIKGIIRVYDWIGIKRWSSSGMPGRFLIVSTTGIGDTLWGTPAISALRETYPESYIGILTTRSGSELLLGNPDIDEIFIFRRGLGSIIYLISLLGRIRARRFEVAFIFHASDRIIWPICSLSGPSEIIGVSGENKGLDFILTRAIEINSSEVHELEKRLILVRGTGAETSNRSIKLVLTDRDRENAERFLQQSGVDNSSLLIGLHPGALKRFKRWPRENFVYVGRELARKSGAAIVITGSRDEETLTSEIAAHIEGAFSAAGRLSLRETAALIERMNLFITNDTGPMHIAFALGTPTVALFSPTDPKRCGPYETEGYIVINKPVTCDPCKAKSCYNPVCMEQITTEEVVEAAVRLLKERN
jgi:lipopolysaccharide heptosyltransferase II